MNRDLTISVYKLNQTENAFERVINFQISVQQCELVSEKELETNMEPDIKNILHCFPQKLNDLLPRNETNLQALTKKFVICYKKNNTDDDARQQ